METMTFTNELEQEIDRVYMGRLSFTTDSAEVHSIIKQAILITIHWEHIENLDHHKCERRDIIVMLNQLYRHWNFVLVLKCYQGTNC